MACTHRCYNSSGATPAATAASTTASSAAAAAAASLVAAESISARRAAAASASALARLTLTTSFSSCLTRNCAEGAEGEAAQRERGRGA